jgi:drug/metabolite transporter (DMT)-like permease
MTSVSPATTAIVADRARRRLALLALGLGALAIGSSPIFVRLSEVGPLATGVWRTALAVLPALLWAAREVPPTREPARTSDRLFAVLAGLCLAGDLAAWHISIGMTSVAEATLFSNAAPLFVTVAGALLLGERITRRFAAALGTACAGAAVIQLGSASGMAGDLAGNGLALLAAAFYSGYILLIGRIRARMGTGAVLLWSSATAAVALLPATLLAGEQVLPTTLAGLAVLFGVGWISHATGQGLVTFALAVLPASFTALTLMAQPVSAALLAWLVLSEPVALPTAIGGAIVLFGIMLARRA